MRLRFSLAWLRSTQTNAKVFKMAAAQALFAEYVKRISHFLPCATGAFSFKRSASIWVCEREKAGKTFSSENLARELQKCMNSGVQELQIVIGGPDGFASQELNAMHPALRWSFGPMTLPHELAAIVAAEQIYRALSIINKKPYHSGHL